MITNVAINHPTPTQWFQCKGADKIQPSEAEKLIIRALNGHEIEYYTEVSFLGMKYSTGGYARYDIWLPTLNTVIEYDGEQYHKSDIAIQKDSLKTRFCTKNKIVLVRLNKHHYYNIGPIIAGIIRKSEVVQSIPAIKRPKVINKKKNKGSKGKYKQPRPKNSKKAKKSTWSEVKEVRKQKSQEEIKKLIANKINTSEIKLPKNVTKLEVRKFEIKYKRGATYGTGR